MNKKRIVLPVAGLLLLSGLFAIANNYHWFGLDWAGQKEKLPDAKEELRKLYAVYSRPDTSFSVQGVIRLYDRQNSDALQEQTTFIYSKKGTHWHSRLGYLETLVDDSLFVQLDTLNKFIIVARADSRSGEASPQTGLPFDRLMEDSFAFKTEAVLTEQNQQRVLTVKSELSPEIRSSVIHYDPQTYRIKKAEIEWWKEPVVFAGDNADKKTWLTVIDYNYPVPEGPSVGQRIKKIIIWRQGDAEPAPAYKDYQIRTTF